MLYLCLSVCIVFECMCMYIVFKCEWIYEVFEWVYVRVCVYIICVLVCEETRRGCQISQSWKYWEIISSSLGEQQILSTDIPFLYPPFLYYYFILCVWMFYLHVCLCTTCVPGVLGDQNRILDPLRLELYMFVSCQPCMWVWEFNPSSGRAASVPNS